MLQAPSALEPYLIDERRRFHGGALAVVQPGSTTEVAKVVKTCAAWNTPIVPQGGNTGLCGGATAPAGINAVVVSLERLRSVRQVDPANSTITVDAGVTVAAVADAAAADGRLFPLRFGADGTAQIGGALSTNAGGMGVLRYGSARDLALGVEAVLADGQVFSDLAGLRKDNTGYALSDLFMGAEGTLGIITGATLRLYSLPVERITALAAVASTEGAVELLGRLRAATDDRLAVFEWMNRSSLEILGRPHPLAEWDKDLLLLEATSGVQGGDLADVIAAALQGAIADGLLHDATLAGSAADRQAFWAIREGISEAEKRIGGSIKHDVSVAISDVPEMLRRAESAIEALAPNATISAFGHLGDGNIHINVIGQSPEEEASLTKALFDVVASLDGSFSAEHGIGRLRRDELARRKPAIDLQLMRAMKQALDPAGLMNPGAVL